MFADRRDAGRQLAAKLISFRSRPDGLILAIPRGGVAIGSVLAEELDLPLEIILTKKIGHPSNPEYAVGVVNLHGEMLDEVLIKSESIPRSYIDEEIARIRAQLRKRHELYHDRRLEISLRGKTVILCDDGIATGYTMLAAARLARREGAAQVIAAAPVGALESIAAIREFADEAVCVLEPAEFSAISQFYRDFNAVEDTQAIRLLESAP